MSLSHQIILDIQITASPREKILEHIKKYLDTSISRAPGSTKNSVKPLVVLTPNPEQIVFATRYPEFAGILNWADVTLPDGVGIVWASRFLAAKKKNTEMPVIAGRIAGVDFVTDLAALAAARGVRIGLIGGFDGLAVNALECLRASHPRLTGWAEDGPELDLDGIAIAEQPAGDYWDILTQKILHDRTAILFVGMGVPKQELVIRKIAAACVDQGISSPLVLMAVGGTFAMITGRLKRAPLLIRSIGFEWFWRLLQEPWRLSRQLSLVAFVWMVMKKKFLSRMI